MNSFTKVASALGYTQSAISHMIASLESEYAIKILYRSRMGVHLTIEGKQLYPFIQSMIQQHIALQEKVAEINGLGTGIIRIGTISSISAHWLPQLIQRFQNRYPQVRFVLHQGDYTSIPEWLQTGQIDFGFVNSDAVPSMPVQFIKTGELRAIVPANHALSQKSFVTLTELAKEPFLELEEGAYSEPMAAFSKLSLQPQIKLRVHDDYSILSMIEAGMGVSILPELVLRKTIYNVAILPIYPTLIRKIGILKQEEAMLPIASKKFIEFLMANTSLLPE